MKTVQVLLSSYNGQDYIEQQIISILNQEGIKSHILIRDDGSNDRTVEIINNLKKIYPARIDLILGKNIGYKKSFLSLCHETSSKFDYYAFSDQDDYWKKDKLKIAVTRLEKSSKDVKLYASTVTICDNNLNSLYVKDISNFKNTFGSALTRIRLAGCTYVFNKRALELLKRVKFKNIEDKKMPSHDGLLFTICKAVDGFVYVDNNSYILHRRRQGSITSGGNGIIKRLKIETRLVFKNKNDKTCLVKILKDNFINQITSENLEIINDVLTYKSSIMKRVFLANNKKLDCGIWLANLERKIKVLTGNF